MITSRLKLKLYDATRFRFAFYIFALLVILIPMAIVTVDKSIFRQSDINIIIPISFAFFLVGRILALFKKTVENGSDLRYGIAKIIGLTLSYILYILYRIF